MCVCVGTMSKINEIFHFWVCCTFKNAIIHVLALGGQINDVFNFPILSFLFLSLYLSLLISFSINLTLSRSLKHTHTHTLFSLITFGLLDKMRILEGQEKWEPAGIPIGALIHLTSARVQPKHTHTHPVASGQQYYIVACDPLWKSSDHGFLPPSAKSYSIAPTLKEVKGSPNWSVCNWDCLECVLKTLISGTYDQIPGNMGAGFVTSYRLGIFVLSETQSATASMHILQDFSPHLAGFQEKMLFQYKAEDVMWTSLKKYTVYI